MRHYNATGKSVLYVVVTQLHEHGLYHLIGGFCDEFPKPLNIAMELLVVQYDVELNSLLLIIASNRGALLLCNYRPPGT